AGGNLGPAILEALDKDAQFTVSVLSRQSSNSTFPSHIKVHTISDSYPAEELAEVFKGQDAIVSTVSIGNNDVQKTMIDVAAKAGVKRFMPAEYGTNGKDLRSTKLLPMYKGKAEIIEYLEAQQSEGVSWTALATGPFFDWSFKSGVLGFDLASQKATIYDTGNSRWSTTTLPTIGTAVARVLHKPEETANKYLLVSSFTPSQNEVLAALEKHSGKKWHVEHRTSEEAAKTGKEKLGLGGADYYSGVLDLLVANIFGENRGSNFEESEQWANHLLGLPKETVDEVVARIVKA
ncbi:hypothetical protein LTR04_001950, partial [Oleoguttula sp. CCFEE 6159]